MTSTAPISFKLTVFGAETLNPTENILSNLDREARHFKSFFGSFYFPVLECSFSVGILTHNSHLFIRRERVHRRSKHITYTLYSNPSLNVCLVGVFNHRIDFIKLPFHSSSNRSIHLVFIRLNRPILVSIYGRFIV